MVSRAREALAIYRKNQDLIAIGAYPAGSNAVVDQAIHLNATLQKFLRQPLGEASSAEQSWISLRKALLPGPRPLAPARSAGGGEGEEGRAEAAKSQKPALSVPVWKDPA